MLAIVDYKAGNQTSVARALAHLGIPSRITASLEDLAAADGIIFPGVGAAGQAMEQLAATGLDRSLRDFVACARPLLGICLGSQIILERSEEDDTPTLGILPGVCKKFARDMKDEDGSRVRIPHMGWNSLIRKKHSRILDNVPENAEFYFVHSYYVEPDPDLVLATTQYGIEFCSLYGRDGLWCAQFHPEKSGSAGLKILENFQLFCMEARNAV